MNLSIIKKVLNRSKKKKAAPVKYTAGDPYHIINSRGQKEITLQKMCGIMGIEMPEKFNDMKDKVQNHVTFNWKDQVPGMFVFRMWDLRESGEEIARAVEKTVEKGAAVVFVPEEQYQAAGLADSDLPAISLPDAINTMGKFYSYMKDLNDVKTIAVTGTCGKTTTMHFLNSIVPLKYKVYTNKGNANTYYSISNHILKELTPDRDIYIQETGAGIPDSVRKCATMLDVDAFILLNIFNHHINQYKTSENLLLDKSSYDDYMGDEGVVITNYDDELIAAHEFKHRVISFGIETDREVDYRAENIKQKGPSLELTVSYEGRKVPLSINILGEQNAYNVLAAFAMARWLDIDEKTIVKGFESYRSKGKRQNFMNISGCNLLVDCYNICEDSLKANLDTVRNLEIPEGKKKVAIITGENKLGDDSERISYEMGKTMDFSGFEHVICVGHPKETRFNLYECGNGRAFYEGILAGGYKDITYVTNVEDLSREVEKWVDEGDTALFKGIYTLDLQLAIDKVFGTSIGMNDPYYIKKAEHVEDDTFGGIKIKALEGVCLTELKKPVSGEIVIPDEIGGYPVTHIGRGLFSMEKKLKSVVIGKNVVNIGRRAFAGCLGLKKLTVPGNVKIIEDLAFKGCVRLSELKLEEGISHIGRSSFGQCMALKKVEMPESVKTLAEDAFEDCPFLNII